MKALKAWTGKGFLISPAPLWLPLLYQHEEDQSVSHGKVPNSAPWTSHSLQHTGQSQAMLPSLNCCNLCALQVSWDEICFCQIRLIPIVTLEREGELKDSKFSIVKGFKSEVQGLNNIFSEYYVTIKSWKSYPVSWKAVMSGGFSENILIGLFGHIQLVTQSAFQNCFVLTWKFAKSLLASSLEKWEEIEFFFPSSCPKFRGSVRMVVLKSVVNMALFCQTKHP